MKEMKLYDQVDRVYRELAVVGIGQAEPLTVDQLTPFDQYHYFGTDAVDQAIASLGLQPGMRVLDVGAGIGGPARYLAAQTGADVVAVELQPDLHDVATELTARCGLHGLVEHRCANVLDGIDGIDGEFDAIISLLCFLHIADRSRLLEVCRGALKPGGGLYVDDYALRRAPTAAEAEALATKVQCRSLPSIREYDAQLRSAGFDDVAIADVTTEWTEFTAARLAAFRSARDRNVAVHGADLVDGLDDFYATVATLFADGVIAGVTITAR